jgi:hypothetical protein
MGVDSPVDAFVGAWVRPGEANEADSDATHCRFEAWR